MVRELSGQMTKTNLCKGCYIWENKVQANCGHNPFHEKTNEVICPCIECLVKCVCNVDIDCLKYTEAFVTTRHRR